jgi:pimeloyl-ACP methyl ester carboxylesterase
MRIWLLPLLFILSTSVLAAPDYARETRWAEEITPAIVVGDPITLQQNNGHKFLGIYSEATDAKTGIVVVHGMGIHPDWGFIGTLRQRLAELGHTTLSIQMPVLAVDAKYDDYRAVFPDAVERIQLAVAYLKSKGFKRTALVSHSIGTHMSHEYMMKHPKTVNAWIALGMPSTETYENVKTPVLDLYGDNDLPRVLSGAAKRKASLKSNASSKQVIVVKADHFFAGQEETMIKTVKDFLDGLK